MKISQTDVAANRKALKWSKKELLGRVTWRVVGLFFSYSPRPFWVWRVLLLRLMGADIGKHVRIHPSAKISIPWNIALGDYSAIGHDVKIYALGKIRIGTRTTVSQGAHLCAGTHNYKDPQMQLIKSPISIGNDVWICADAFVNPGITIGNRAIVGARGVVTKNIKDNQIVGGNPARTLKHR